jgi:hypothetical protein
MSEIVELPCSPEVERIVSQIVRGHVSHGQNTVWISTFSPDTDHHIWRWMAIPISRQKGQELLRILSDGKTDGKKDKKKK